MSRSHFRCGSLLFPSGMQWIWGKRPISRNPLVALDPWISTVSGACKSSSTAQHQSIPKDTGMCFPAIPQRELLCLCHWDWAVPGAWSTSATGWRPFPEHSVYDHFSNFCSTYSFFPGNSAATGGPLSFLAKPEHFLRACLVQYVGIFSLFTLTAAHCHPHSCSIYPTGNS